MRQSQGTLDHQARLAAGQACLDAALQVYLPRGFSITCCCDPDHIGVGRDHGKACDSPGKTPMHKWKNLQTSLPSANDVRQRWKDFPYGNVGCVLGQASGVVRVDVDGAEGEGLLAQWSGGELPATWIFRSSAEGRGLLYAWPRNLPCKSTTQARPGDHKELRLMGNGSQTVLPPSRHPSGSLYAWELGHGPNDRPLAPAPAWLVERLRQEPRQDTQRQGGGTFEGAGYARVASALASIPNNDASYDEWIVMGMSLHSTEASWARAVWDGWSRQSGKFNEGKQEKSWSSFTADGKTTIATLFHLAKQHGWHPPAPPKLIVRNMAGNATADGRQHHETTGDFSPRAIYQRRQEARIARYKQQLYADPYFGAPARRGQGLPVVTIVYKETSHVT